MYDYDLIFWGAVFAVMVIAELASFQLISIWFAIGALVTFIMALCGAELGIQMLVFTVVSIVLLLFTRPLLKKFAVKKIQPTNIELDVGKTAVVIEEINNKIETLHTSTGAISESFEKFIKPLKLDYDEDIAILDICAGLGYNSSAAIADFLEHKGSGNLKIDMV